MTRFFWRIFLSVWVIATSTVVLAVYLSRLLPSTEPAVASGEQVAELVARDLRAALNDRSLSVSEIAERYAIDVAPMLEVFILDREGHDVLERRVPEEVYRALVGEEVSWWLPTDWPRVSVVSGDVHGYTVVSYEDFFIFGRAMGDPMARAILLAVALVISIVVSALLARFVVRPVERLREAGRLVASGDLSVRVAPELGKRQDTLAELAHDFDYMTERVASSLTAQRQMMRDVSHELRSPLARLQALISVAGQRDDSAGPEFLLRIENELDRLDELIGEILAFSRLQMQEQISRTRTDIVDLTQTIVDDASIEAEASNKRVVMRSPEHAVQEVDYSLVHSAIENIVRNAIRHTAEGTDVVVSIEVDASGIHVDVSDRGPGVPEEALETIFLPFYRIEDGRPTHTGSGGIGLAIAARTAALHGGSIVARNRKPNGLSVILSLPTVGVRK